MHTRRIAWMVVACGMLACSVSASARAHDPATERRKAEARELAQQGDAAFKVGRCDQAIPFWQKANARFQAPTILFRIARCQALMGKVVAATATLEQLLALPDDPDSPPAFREAKDQAAAELPAVRSRIAFLTVAVDARGVDVQPDVRVDDQTLPMVEGPVPIDPGAHVVRVRARDATWERKVTLQEGQSETVRVAIGVHMPPRPARTQRTVGYVLGGIGLASLAAGAYFGASASTLARHLERVCGTDRKQCPADRKDDIDRLKTHAVAADITLGAGAALFAAGAIVALTEPAPKQEEPRVVLFPVGFGAALHGWF
jgi:tetratricopeptide (TPR) repeat protein